MIVLKEKAWVLTLQVPEYIAELKSHESIYSLHGIKQISLCPVCLPPPSGLFFWDAQNFPLPVEIRLSLHAAPDIFWNKKGDA